MEKQYVTFSLDGEHGWKETPRGLLIARVDGALLRIPAHAQIGDRAQLVRADDHERVVSAAAATDAAATKAEKAWMQARLEADRAIDKAAEWERSFNRMSDAYAAQVTTTGQHQQRIRVLEEEQRALGAKLAETQRQLKLAQKAAARYADANAIAIDVIARDLGGRFDD